MGDFDGEGGGGLRLWGNWKALAPRQKPGLPNPCVRGKGRNLTPTRATRKLPGTGRKSKQPEELRKPLSGPDSGFQGQEERRFRV